MLGRQLRGIGIFDGLMIVILAGGLTFAGLSLAGVADDGPPSVTVATSVKPATTAQTSTRPATTDDGAATTPATTEQRPATPEPTADQERREAAARSERRLRRAIGQTLITGMDGTRASGKLLEAARTGKFGGVILFGHNIVSGAQVKALNHGLQAAAVAGGNPRLLIMVDQEGGQVRRLTFAPPTLSARAMGAHPGPGLFAQQQGEDSGRALRAIGVNVNLAPVADVPSGPSNFLVKQERAFSGNASAVAASACAFSRGLAAGGVVPTLKHFPGLGHATTANTDLEPVHVNVPLEALRRDWIAYNACGNDGLVMLSNASYQSLTGNTPAVMSPKAVAALRKTGFRGLTITDSLAAKALDRERPVALKAARAGVDLQLYQSEGQAQQAFANLREAVHSRRLPRSILVTAADRIKAFKTTRLRSAG